MVPDRRGREISDHLGASGAVRVADPAEPPQASDTTVRRVPVRLARDADVRKVRGIPGATVVTVPSHAIGLLQDGPATGRTVVLPGGVRTPSDALVGPLTTAALRTRHAGRCFLGVHGLREQDGRTAPNTVEVATIVTLNDLLGPGLDRPATARLTQRAENEFVGAPTGLRDQSASLMGRAGSALFLDCRSLTTELVPLPVAEHGFAVLVIDTEVAHSHAGGGYGARRASCQRAAAALGVVSLRDVPADAELGSLDEETTRRVRHVLGENRRALETVDRLRAGDVAGTGPLLTASHASLRDDYEVSCPELDLAVDTALAAGAAGARMTGGGFGGSAIALVPAGEAARVGAAVTEAFARAGHRAPGTFGVAPAEGAGRVR